MATGKKGELRVFGAGPKGPSQLTLDALEGIKGCDAAFGTVFPDELAAFCAGLGVKYTPLTWGGNLAQSQLKTSPGGGDSDAVHAALFPRLSKGETVGLIVDGHPAVFCFATGLAAEARAAGYATRTWAAIGALDEILAGLPPETAAALEPGFTVFSLLTPGASAHGFSPALPALLFNVGHLFRARRADFDAFLRDLVGRAGAREEVLLVECVPGGRNERRCALEDLPKELPFIGVNATAVLLRPSGGKAA